MIRRGLFALLGGLIAATSAQAEWLEARSRHFVLYSNSSEATLRKQSEALERLDWGPVSYTHLTLPTKRIV